MRAIQTAYESSYLTAQTTNAIVNAKESAMDFAEDLGVTAVQKGKEWIENMQANVQRRKEQRQNNIAARNAKIAEIQQNIQAAKAQPQG